MRRAARIDANVAWRCANCGIEARPTVHQMRKTYCSGACMSDAYKTRMAGSANPNFRQAGHKVCQQCAAPFHSYSPRKFCGLQCYYDSRSVLEDLACQGCKSTFRPRTSRQRFCSPACARASQVKPRPAREPGPVVVAQISCSHCATSFRALKSSNRKYCSYACHLASGGARRAGEAAVMAKLKYGAKKDANHREIFAYIEVFTAVKDLSNAGCGVPDGLAWVSGGWRLFDVKNRGTAYGRRGLNPIQKRWADDWRGGPVYLIHDIEEAALFVKGEFGSLTSFPAPEVAA